ncbi:SPBC16D10.01c, related [Neospora caninum Liverpool]|uniref:SPBC16D10.01c, related n=1 Tax=Neospora caninum (strain Liverpool) TaxID=572307 RepID=F0VG44_NEOCL|nr:SPBC16D10.01c, related [Neospora caninum Liverpool]CBZ52688.1 SPBC16D10.01c, related [Neospora caninum Liverpool]|eukprot:XP_003882720.1 SPBC16D10.01c, related [Neospora caninum Liverpool]
MKKKQNRRRAGGGQASPAARSAVATEVQTATDSEALSLPPSFFLQRAEGCVNAFPPDFSLARKFLRKGVSVHPNDVSLLVRAAEMLSEDGQLDEAKQLLQRAIQLEPDRNPEKFFYLAQIEEGRTSLELFRRAAGLLEASLQNLEASIAAAQVRESQAGNSGRGATAAAVRLLKEERRRVTRQLVDAKCSVGELYMTDLCDAEEAEEACRAESEGALALAEAQDAGLPDALHLRASFLKTIGDIEGARAAALRAAHLIHAQLKRREENLRLVSPSSEDEDDVSCRELRVNLARVLIDVQEAEAAVLLVSSCIEEDDQDADSWLILACGLFKAKKFAAARDSLEHLQQVSSLGFFKGSTNNGKK